MKTCTKCHESKDESCFRVQKTGRNGLHSSCKQCESAYGKARRAGPQAEEIRAYHRLKTAEYRKKHPEKAKESKRKYYSSEAGKMQKRKEDRAYILSGGRALAEKRRAEKPLSEARIQSRLRYSNRKRSSEKQLCEFDLFVLAEAVDLMRLRNKTKCCGTRWHVDHVIAIANGGSSKHDNLQVVPAKWNQSKSNKHSKRLFGN